MAGCLVIAHRGSNKKAPQNTMPAFKQAISEKCDGFETDVHLTKDGKAVICHNYTIDDTSNGHGRICDYTFEELRKFDFGSYFSAAFRGTRMPELDEFMSLASFNDVEVINIELKKPESKSCKELVQKTLECIYDYGVLNRVIISSFSPSLLKEVKRQQPLCKTGFLYPTNRPSVCRTEILPFFTAKRIGADYIHPAEFVTSRFIVSTAHRLGLKVNVWTVNDEKKIIRLLNCGVDGIITDCPGKVLKIVNKYEKNS